VRDHGLTYGRFIDGLSKAEIAVDRKVLSDLAITEPAAFAVLVAQAKTALGYLGEIETTTHERVNRLTRLF
jgi:large subunit ribosomal protein L20